MLKNLRKNKDVVFLKNLSQRLNPARIYGLPKMHNPRQQGAVPPFQPIVSSIWAYNYNLAKYLCNLLTPFIPAEFCAEDSFSFVNEIQKLSMHNKFMVSFDVESLFTNIPLEESIDLAVSYITQYTNTTFSAKELKDLFHIATAQSHFSFNGSFYDQVDGVAMGSPLAPVLANLFMGHHEWVWLQNFGLTEVLFYRRYVDDTFCLFHSEADAVQFFHYLNSRHINIRFTMEKEFKNRLPFLDVLIDNNQVPVLTTVFRKSTFTSLLMNFTSFTSYSYKLGLIRILIQHTLSTRLLIPLSISFSSLTGKMATTAQSAPTLNYLTWANFLLLHKSGFAEPFSVFVTTALISS